MAWTGHPMRTGDPDIDGGNYHRDPYAGILEGMGRRIDSLNEAIEELRDQVKEVKREVKTDPAPCECAERLEAMEKMENRVGAILSGQLKLQLHVHRTENRREDDFERLRKDVLDLTRRVRNLEGGEWVQAAQQEGGQAEL